jgi:hypothetical protein
MSFVPEFKLYQTDGLTLVYTFPIVQSTNAPQSPVKAVEIEAIRGQGSIIIDGGVSSWDLTIRGLFYGDDYQALIAKVDDIESKIDTLTPYILKIEKTPSTHYEYKVKRIEPILYEESLRDNYIYYRITLKVNSW